MPNIDLVERMSEGRISYRGYIFSGFNKPRRSWRDGKQKAVLARKGNSFELIHYGDPSMADNRSAKQRDAFISRATGIRDGNGRLTKDNIFSANYWALRDLWDYRG